MTIITGGYDGTVDEVQFAGLLPRYSVVGPDDFKATTQAGDRIVAIGNGTALGPGTIDVASNLPAIQFAVASGTRWDLVVLRRDWQPPGGTSEIKIIQGGTSEAYPAVGTATTAWNRRPGIMDDQPLYLQQVNGTLLGARIDLRCWEANGGLVARDELAKGYLDRLGTEVYIDGVVWRYVPGLNNVPEWVTDGFAELTPLGVSGYSITGKIYTAPAGSTRKRVTVDINVARAGSAGNQLIGTDFSGFGAVIPVAARGASPTKYLPVAVSGGSGGTNEHATISLDPANGSLEIRSATTNFTMYPGALFTINATYYI